MKSLLTFKHWQLFLLFLAVPLLSFVVGIVMALIMDNIMAPVMMLMVTVFLSTAFFMLYQYSVVYHLNRLLPSDIRIDLKLFNLSMIFNIVVVICMLVSFWQVMNFDGTPAIGNFTWVIFMMLAVLLSVVTSLYVLFIMSKALVSVEQHRKITASDHALEFILFWFWIVGIWVLQPRINEIFRTPGDMSSHAIPPPLPVLD